MTKNKLTSLSARPPWRFHCSALVVADPSVTLSSLSILYSILALAKSFFNRCLLSPSPLCHIKPRHSTIVQPCHFMVRQDLPRYGTKLQGIARCSALRYATPNYGTARHGPTMPLHGMPGQDTTRESPLHAKPWDIHATAWCATLLMTS